MNILEHNSPESGVNNQLNIAAFVPQTRVLGPGLRAGVWTQGCTFACPGCIAPDWKVLKINQLIPVHELAERILAEPVDGITLSGGEPFLQPGGLAELLRLLRAHREINCITFTGYSYLALQRMPEAKGLLDQVDLLIDGSYVASRNTGTGLRGSDNQRFHFLTDRLVGSDYPFESAPRGTELHFRGNDLLIVGIPAHGVQTALDHAIQSAQQRSSHNSSQLPLGARV
ncbi:MAG: radical SAM protein [Anaerolineales bacterium]|nr:radical SAM protein [Anaerolineales bacterium]